jgi:hypothetical protein
MMRQADLRGTDFARRGGTRVEILGSTNGTCGAFCALLLDYWGGEGLFGKIALFQLSCCLGDKPGETVIIGIGLRVTIFD